MNASKQESASKCAVHRLAVGLIATAAVLAASGCSGDSSDGISGTGGLAAGGAGARGARVADRRLVERVVVADKTTMLERAAPAPVRGRACSAGCKYP